MLIDIVNTIINAPILPFLDIIKRLLMQPANVQAFTSLWAVIIYVLSAFYGLFMLGAGINLMVSGYNAEKRYRAKEWLQNTILMMFFVQASYLIYSLIAELAAGMTAGIVSIIDPNFFLLTLDNPVNIGLEIVLGIFYILTLLITIVALSVNYLLSSIGIVLFPFGLFFYFIPPLKGIGRFIINKLFFVLFLPFFASLILLGASQLLNAGGVYASIKIILMISAFALVDLLMIILAVIAVARSVTAVKRSDFGRSVVYMKTHFQPAAEQPKYEPRLYYGRERIRSEDGSYWRR